MRSRLFPEFAEGAEGRSGVKAQVAASLRPQLSLVKGCAEEKAPGQRKHRTMTGQGWQSPGCWGNSSPGKALRASWQTADSQGWSVPPTLPSPLSVIPRDQPL